MTRRILLKLSGELMCAADGFGVEPEAAHALASRIRDGLARADTELAIVLGGGNFLRGSSISRSSGDGAPVIDRVSGDQMGMLGTIMNAIGLCAALESIGIEARVQSAIPVGEIAEPFARRRAIAHLEKRRVLLLAGGTGHPFFTTDTTAALRALEIGATQFAKGTKVRGVFSEDPQQNSAAEFFPELTFDFALERRLRVMDAAAFSLCRDNGLAVQVFDMRAERSIERVIEGENIGSLVTAG